MGEHSTYTVHICCVGELLGAEPPEKL